MTMASNGTGAFVFTSNLELLVAQVSKTKSLQLQPFIVVLPQGCMPRPTCIVWANLIPFSLQSNVVNYYRTADPSEPAVMRYPGEWKLAGGGTEQGETSHRR
jgi:hypothetical protein